MQVLSRLEALHRWVTAHFALTVAFAVASLLAALLVSRGVTVEQDIGAMLPDGPGSPREAARLLEEFGVLNVLLLDLELPGASPSELASAGAGLAERLRVSGDFSEVHAGPTTAELLAVGRALFPKRLYLFDDPAATIDAGLNPRRLQVSLGRLKERLAAPQAFVAKDDVLRDPLGLDDEILSRLSGTASVQTQAGQLLSPERTHLLLVTVPRTPALDARASSEMLTRVEAEARRIPAGPRGPARLRAAGGPRFVAESASAVRRDVLVTALTSLLALSAIFAARFRSLRLLLISAVPLVFGLVGGLTTVAVIQGRIHALTFAFGAVLVGIAIDYPIYLLNAASAQVGRPTDRMSAGLASSWRSLWLGFSTTMIAFALMTTSRFPGLRELALFAGAGIAVAFTVTLIGIPPLGARWGMSRLSPIPRWMARLQRLTPGRRWAWAIIATVVAAIVLFLPGLRFDGELRHLDAQKPATLAEYEEVRKRFGLQGADSLVIARGATPEEALRRSDVVTAVLTDAQAQGRVSHVLSLGAFLPSRETQLARRARLGALDEATARAALNRVSAGVGFAEGAFEPFWRDVDSVRSGRTAPLLPEDLAPTSLGALVGRLLRCSAAGCIAVASFEPTGADAVAELQKGLAGKAVVIDGGALAAATVAEIPRQLVMLSCLGLLLNLVLLIVAYRSLREASLACLPGALGLLGTLAVLALLQLPLNLVSASALVLILGCGVDYGIFMVQGMAHRSGGSPIEFTGVLLTSATALAGFGTLALASYRAIQSLGIAVGLGIALSAAVALFILPSLVGGVEQSQGRPG